MESGFFKPPKETKIVLKNQVVLAVVGKILQHLTMGRETFFGLSYWKVQKFKGLRNRDSTILGRGSYLTILHILTNQMNVLSSRNTKTNCLCFLLCSRNRGFPLKNLLKNLQGIQSENKFYF